MPVQNRRSRQDALQTLYPEDTTPDSADSIAAGSDDEPLSEELCELAAVMCEIDVLSIDVIELANERLSTFMDLDKWAREVITPMCSDAKFEEDDRLLRHVKDENHLGNNSFSKGYLSNISVVRYLEQAANIAFQCAQCGWRITLEINRDDFGRLPELAKEFCGLSLKAAGETELSDDVLAAMKNRLVQLDRLSLYVAGPKRMRSWRTMMAEIQKARKERVSKKAGEIPVERYQMRSDWTSTLVAITGVTILLAMVPTYIAWTRSPYSRGSTTDSDFLWLIQSSIMALLSLLTLSVPIYENSKLPFQNWLWTWAFIFLALVAIILGPVLYLFVPTAYSGSTTFVTSVCQAFRRRRRRCSDWTKSARFSARKRRCCCHLRNIE